MMNELAGKVAIITGGGSGIGSSIAKAFVDEGASVVIADINLERAEKVVESIKAKNGRAFAIRTDVVELDDVNRMIEKTLEKFGRIDILVNDVGIGFLSGSINRGQDRMIENLSEELWDKVMNINLKGTFLCSKAVIPTMKKQKNGNIINISSSSAFISAPTNRGSGPHYNVSKAGVVSLTKSLAVQLGPHNIRANCIAPGIIFEIDPDGTKSSGFGFTPEYEALGGISMLLKGVPLGRLGRPKDVANVALFLASDKSGYVNGATIDVNGGEFTR